MVGAFSVCQHKCARYAYVCVCACACVHGNVCVPGYTSILIYTHIIYVGVGVPAGDSVTARVFVSQCASVSLLLCTTRYI